MKKFLFVIPWLFLFLLSIGTSWIYPQIIPDFTFKGWVKNLPHVNFISSFFLSIFTAIASTGTGFLLAKKEKPTIWSYLPYLLSPVILGAGLHYFFILLGLSGSYFGVILGQILMITPFAFLFFYPFWSGYWLKFENISKNLGASSFYTFKNIILPIAFMPMVTCFFQCFLFSWFDYGLTSIVGEGKVKTLTVSVFQYLKEGNLFPAAKSAFLLTLPPLVLFWLNKKFILTQIES